jgi:hypothetical protein
MKTFQELRGQLKNNYTWDPEINSGLNTQLISSKTLLSQQKVWKVFLPAGCVRPTMSRLVKDGFLQT